MRGQELSLFTKILSCIEVESYLRQEKIELSTDQSWPYCLVTWDVTAVKTASKSLSVCCSVAQLCLTLHEPMGCSTPAFLSFTISWSLLKLMSVESMMPSNHLILCHPLLCLPSTFPSIRVFSSELALCIRWPKYWSFSFSISPPNEYSGFISFRIDWFDLLALQGTLKRPSLAPPFKSIKSLVLSFLYGPTLISIHDYWKKHGFDCMDICWQSDVSAF